MRGWARAARRSLAAAAAVVVAATGVTVQPVAGATTCSDTQLVPQVRDFDVLQGLPYARLARGKDALAKLFLSLPDCATGTDASIQLLDGSTLKVGGTTIVAPAPAAGGPFPAVAPFGAAPAPDATGDPVWPVPGSALADVPVAPLPTTFEATVRYQARLTATGAWSATRTATFRTDAFVDKATNPLRVLFVPMGDASRTGQFGASANLALQQGVDTLSRLFPVRAGVASLGTPEAAGAGVAYALNAGLLDLGPNGLKVMANGSFCGTGGNFDPIKGALGSLLTAWNSANRDAQADRVIGVVDQAVSAGGLAGCAEGMALVDGSVAWVRARYDRNGNSTVTGATMGMELGHTLGLSTLGGTDPHSPNKEADRGANRAYNVRQARYLSQDRTVMNFTDSAWIDPNVLLEAEDWEFAQCRLGGLSLACTGSGAPVGTVAAAGPRFVLDALLHPDGAGGHTAEILDAELRDDDGQAVTQPAPGSPVRIRFRAADGEVVGEEGVPLHGDETHGDGHDPVASVHVSRPFDTRARQWQLLEGGRVLAERPVGAPPEIVSAGEDADTAPDDVSSIAPYTATPATDERRPALRAGAVAWGTTGALYVAPVDDPAVPGSGDGWGGRVAVPASAGATSPAFDRAGTRLAFETAGGDVDVVPVTVDPATGAVTVDAAGRQRVYDSALAVLQRPAHHPSFSPAGDVVIEVAGDLYVIDLTPDPLGPLTCVLGGVLPCRQVTTGGGASAPSWAPTGNLVAYAEGGDVRVVDTGTLVDRVLVVNGRDPAWDGTSGAPSPDRAQRLAFVRDDPGTGGPDLWVTDPTAAPPLGPTTAAQRLTHLGADAHPAIVWSSSGGLLAVERQFANPAQSDVVLVTVAPNDDPSPTRDVYTTVARSDRPGDLRARFFRQCRDGRLHPLAWGVRADDVDGREARFRIVFDAGSNPTQACPDGITRHEVSDGTQRASVDRGAASVDDRAPVAAVVSPSDGAVYRQAQAVVVACAGRDAEHGALPAPALSAAVAGPQSAAGGARIVLSPAPGQYVVTCTATSDGVVAAATVRFTVLGPKELVGVDADPDSLLVPPPPSEPKTISMIVTAPPGRDLRDVPRSAIRLSRVGSVEPSGAEALPALAWEPVTTGGGPRRWVAKFDRLKLAAVLQNHGLVDQVVTLAIVGEASAWGFEGDDDINVRSS